MVYSGSMSAVDQTPPSAEQLGSRLEFETLISDTSASLLATAPEQLDRAIEACLDHVRNFFQVDRCALLSVSPDQQVVSVRLASYSEGVPHVPTDLNLAKVFPWSRHTLLVERAPVRISRIDDLPPEADTERDIWIQMPIRSALTLPIETGGVVSHLIVLNSVHGERDWPDPFVVRLRVLGEMLVGAMKRGEMFVQLRQAEERLSLAADSAEAGLWTLNHRTGVVWATERARAVFGYSPGEIIDINRFEASVHPHDWGLIRDALDRSMREGEPIDVEYRITLPGDGRVRWIRSRGRPQLPPTGQPDCVMGISIDITESRNIQERLRLSEARLASGADLAGLGFYEVHFGEGVAYADDRVREVCGVPPEQTSGLQVLAFWKDHLHPDDRSWVLNMREELHAGRLDRISCEYRFLHPVQGEKWIEHLARVAVRDPTGRAIATYGVLRDITGSKRIEGELRALSQRLIRAHEEERSLLARELHDDVSQRLAALAIDVGRIEAAVPEGEQVQEMRSLREGLVSLSEDIHSLAYQLHPSVLEELGLVEALRAECERLDRQGQLRLSADLDPIPGVLGRDVALCLFRVAQEALNNVARHADACTATVTLRQINDGFLLTVRDDGVGFDPAQSGDARSLGLMSMHERVRLVNGTLNIESAPGRGTEVTAWAPGEEEAP